MRKKTIELDGEQFLIGALTLEQVEEFVRPDAKPEILEVIRMSLANADAAAGWSIARLKKELDIPLRQSLFDQILAFSGLSKTGEAKPAGEHSPSVN